MLTSALLVLINVKVGPRVEIQSDLMFVVMMFWSSMKKVGTEKLDSELQNLTKFGQFPI